MGTSTIEVGACEIWSGPSAPKGLTRRRGVARGSNVAKIVPAGEGILRKG